MRAIKNTDKGVAGLTILLSIVTMLFVIGLLVMIFSLMGGELQDASYTATSGTVTNETVTGGINVTGTSAVANSGLRDFSITVTAVHNATGGQLIPSANYTVASDGSLTNATVSVFEDFPVNVSYTYTYNADNTATNVMNDTVAGISGTTDWFDIFLVISAMVVLILLTVIIITAIRGSGLLQTGSA